MAVGVVYLTLTFSLQFEKMCVLINTNIANHRHRDSHRDSPYLSPLLSSTLSILFSLPFSTDVIV